MLPELLHIGSFPVRTYGIMIALAFFAGVIYVRFVTKRDGRRFEPYLVLSYILIFGGIFGARLAYVLMHTEEFTGHWTDTFNPFAHGQFGIAGLNLYGGVVVAIALALIYLRIRKLSVLVVFDYFAPALGLGLFLGRIGCFCNGCCFGTATNLPWGVVYPVGSIPWFVYGQQALHPAQLYSALYGLGLFFSMHLLLGKKRFDGQVAAIFLMIESIFRFAIESVRYYETDMYFAVGGLRPTFNHLIAIVLFLFGVIIFWTGLRKRAAAHESQ